VTDLDGLEQLLYLIDDLWRIRDHSDDLPGEGHAMSPTEEARLRNRKLREIGSLEVFPAGTAVLAETEAGPTLREVVVAVTDDDFVLLDADVKREPAGEFGRIGRAEVAGLRMVDEQGQPVVMLQSRIPSSSTNRPRVDTACRSTGAREMGSRHTPSSSGRCRWPMRRDATSPGTSRTSDAAPIGVEWSSLAARIPRLGDARSNARSLGS
jgi:hypothetical protein